MGEPDFDLLRRRIVTGSARIEVRALTLDDLESIAWSGGRPHLENVARQLARVASGEVDYLAIYADGYPVSKGGVDFAKEANAGTIWQVATYSDLWGLGLATTLIHELEARVVAHGLRAIRLAVGPENDRARRLYEHLGYVAIGESEASWEAEHADGSRYIHSTRLVEMVKSSGGASANPP